MPRHGCAAVPRAAASASPVMTPCCSFRHRSWMQVITRVGSGINSKGAQVTTNVNKRLASEVGTCQKGQ